MGTKPRAAALPPCLAPASPRAGVLRFERCFGSNGETSADSICKAVSVSLLAVWLLFAFDSLSCHFAISTLFQFLLC